MLILGQANLLFDYSGGDNSGVSTSFDISVILTLRDVDFATGDAIVGPAGLLAQLQVVSKYVEGVVLIVRL